VQNSGLRIDIDWVVSTVSEPETEEADANARQRGYFVSPQRQKTERTGQEFLPARQQPPQQTLKFAIAARLAEGQFISSTSPIMPEPPQSPPQPHPDAAPAGKGNLALKPHFYRYSRVTSMNSFFQELAKKVFEP